MDTCGTEHGATVREADGTCIEGATVEHVLTTPVGGGTFRKGDRTGFVHGRMAWWPRGAV